MVFDLLATPTALRIGGKPALRSTITAA